MNEPLSGLTLLVLDDEPLLRKQISASLERLGADVMQVADVAGARRLAADFDFDFAFLDVNLPDGLGTDLLKEKVFRPATGVIVMTANGGIGGAVEAMRLGAIDYLVKPFDPAELPLVVRRAQHTRQSARAIEHRRAKPDDDGFFFGSALGGVCAQLDKILAADRRMGEHLPPVLIVGETGTGKSTIARWLHRNGPRAGQELVEVNCSALPENLAESELFGHERGAFTDAKSARLGLFEAASGGSLFLDELPSLSPGLQAKVLTAIEDAKIRRVGGNKAISVDARIIAATNRDLKAAVAAKEFREDLYHRLDLYRVVIPPLRDRGDDVLKLAGKLITATCRRHRVAEKKISKPGSARMLAYRWPGNVRELMHEIERAVVFEDGAELDFPHLAADAASGGSSIPGTEWLNPAFRYPADGFSLDQAIDRLAKRALEQTDGNVSGAARLLGVTRDYVRYRMDGGKRVDG